MKIGDKVVKFKEYDAYHGSYCKFGGDQNNLPLQSKGTITDMEENGDNSVTVNFKDGIGVWKLDKSELALLQGGLMNSLEQYYNDHQDTILTLALVLLVDFFMFDGALRDRIKDTLEKMLGKVEKEIGK